MTGQDRHCAEVHVRVFLFYPSPVALPQAQGSSSVVLVPLCHRQRTQAQQAAPAKPDALAAAASLLAERIRLLSLSKPPRCSAAAPCHPVFRCHYLNMLLIQPWSPEVCSHWSSAHSTWTIEMALFPGGDRGHEHNSLLESFSGT